MKISHTNWANKKSEVSIAEAISESVEDNLSEGQMETIQGKLNNLTNLIGKLVEALHTNHKLTDEQVKNMLSWRYTIED